MPTILFNAAITMLTGTGESGVPVGFIEAELVRKYTYQAEEIKNFIVAATTGAGLRPVSSLLLISDPKNHPK